MKTRPDRWEKALARGEVWGVAVRKTPRNQLATAIPIQRPIVVAARAWDVDRAAEPVAAADVVWAAALAVEVVAAADVAEDRPF